MIICYKIMSSIYQYTYQIKINNYFEVWWQFNHKRYTKRRISSSVIDFININQWENKTTEGIQYMDTLEARKLSLRRN